MPDYAITAVTRRVVYSGSAGTGPYNYSFPVLTSSDIDVYKDTTLLTETTHYSVTVSSSTGTGAVTLVDAATSANTITLVGARSLERSTDFVTAGDLLASSINTELDSQTIFNQQVLEITDRALTAPVTDPLAVNMVLPAKADRLGKYLSFHATTGNPEMAASSDDVATLAAITADIATLADIEDGTDATDAIQTAAGVAANITTVAGVAANVTTVAGIAANVTAVAGDATDIGAVAAKATEIGRLGTSDAVADMALLGTSAVVTDLDLLGTSANVTAMGLLGTSANVTAQGLLGTSAVITDMGILGTADVVTDLNTLGTADVVSDLNTLGTADAVSDMNTLAAIASDITSVAADATDIGAVAGKATEIGLLGVSGVITDMGILGTSAIVADMAILGTADVVNDMNILATSDVVTDMNVLATADVVVDMNTLGTADVVTDMNTLGTADVVTDMNTLGTADVVADMNTLGTADVVSDMNTLAAVASDISNVASQVIGYTFSTTTSMADPGSAGLRFNHGTIASCTAIAIDDLDNSGADVSPYIITFDDSTNTIKGTLLIRSSAAASTFAMFSVTGLTDNSGWTQLAVTHLASNGTFSDASTAYISFLRAGNKGADGAGSMTSFTAAGDSGSSQAIVDGNTLQLTGGDGVATVASATDTVTIAADLKSNGGIVIESGELAVDLAASSITNTLAVGDGGTGATTASAGATALGVGTGDSPQFTAVNIGAASDTTVARSGAGDITVEGNAIYRAGGTDVPVADGGTGRSTLTANYALLGNGTSAVQMVSPGTSGNTLTSNGSTWQSTTPAGGGAGYFLGGASGATGDTTNGLTDIFRVNNAAIATSCTIAASTNASACGPLTINSGVTVTVTGTMVVI